LLHEGDLHQPAVPRQAAQIAGGVGGADHVQYDIDAGFVGGGGDGLIKIGFFIIDPGSAQFFDGRAFFRRAGGGKHFRPPCHRHLDGGDADPRRAAMHEERFSGGEATNVEYIRPHGKEGFG
jgi:hypothetical protein